MVVCKPHVLWGTPATGASVLQCSTERTNSSISVPQSGQKAVIVPQSGQKALSMSHRADEKLSVPHRADKQLYRCPTERTKSSRSVPQSGQKAQGVSHRADKKLYQCPFAGSVTVPLSSFLNNTCRQDTSTIQELTTVRLRAEPVKLKRQHFNSSGNSGVQELCESGGGRPGLSVLMSLKPVLNWANVCSPEHTSDTSTNYDSFLN